MNQTTKDKIADLLARIKAARDPLEKAALQAQLNVMLRGVE
jgi:hypothetical protein